ncbi:MAG TPA: dipeptidase [Selenomonadales bacterium]|nr:dipeptidase [Selenomonadales bacterium]
MKVFDGHSDILTDVTIKRLNGERDVFRRYHLQQLEKGRIGGIILVVWVDPPYTEDPTWRMLQVLGAAFEEIREMASSAAVVRNFADFEEILRSGRIPILLGAEGLSGLRGNVSLLDMLYGLGLRHATLTWNEENEFATGVQSPNAGRGLTPLGIEAVKRMEELGMLIDVSHANEKTFWDICENTSRPFIASHSNAYRLCPAARNLKDIQIKAVAERQGVIGINSWPEFVDEHNPTIEKLADHIDHIVALGGIDTVGFGFDFCNYLGGNVTASFQHSEIAATRGLEDTSKVTGLLDLLAERGYQAEDIEKIAYKNFLRVIRETIR